MQMRSEPVNPVQRRTTETPREGEAAKPADATADAFEASLRRAGRGRQGLGDETEARDALPQGAPQTLQTSWPVPASPRVEAPVARWAPQAAVAPDAVTRQLKAQALPDAGGEPGRWQLQITEAGLPVQRLDVQRSAAGPVTVLVSALTEAQQPRHTARLRERLAARGTVQVDFRGPPTDNETSSS